MNHWKAIALTILASTSLSWAQNLPQKNYVRVEVAAVRSLPKDTSEQVTQGLLGDEVQVIEERPEWTKVYIKPQYRTEKGYPGWIRKEFVVRQTQIPSAQQVVVSAPQVALRSKPDAKSKIVQRASLGSQLSLAPADGATPEDWVAVLVPGRQQALYAPAKHFAAAADVPVSDGRVIVETAAQLKGTPYLWGGG